MSKIVLHLAGGLIQNGFFIPEKVNKHEIETVKVFVVDTDTEDCQDDDNLTRTTNNGKKIDAYIHQVSFDDLPKNCDIEKLFKKYLRDNK
jgi:transcriptional regulator of met regulon